MSSVDLVCRSDAEDDELMLMQLLDLQNKSDEHKWPFSPRPPTSNNNGIHAKYVKHSNSLLFRDVIMSRIREKSRVRRL